MNKYVRKNVVPLVPVVDRLLERLHFLRCLKAGFELSQQNFCSATAQELTDVRKKLIEGRYFLADRDSALLGRCDRMIRMLDARIATIDAERYLRSNTDPDGIPAPGFAHLI